MFSNSLVVRNEEMTIRSVDNGWVVSTTGYTDSYKENWASVTLVVQTWEGLLELVQDWEDIRPDQ